MKIQYFNVKANSRVTQNKHEQFACDNDSEKAYRVTSIVSLNEANRKEPKLEI